MPTEDTDIERKCSTDSIKNDSKKEDGLHSNNSLSGCLERVNITDHNNSNNAHQAEPNNLQKVPSVNIIVNNPQNSHSPGNNNFITMVNRFLRTNKKSGNKNLDMKNVLPDQ
eukprot:Pgem_evm1s12664